MAINTGLSKILGEKIGVTRVTSISLKAKDIVQLAIIEIRSHFVIKSKESGFCVKAESRSPNSTKDPDFSKNIHKLY